MELLYIVAAHLALFRAVTVRAEPVAPPWRGGNALRPFYFPAGSIDLIEAFKDESAAYGLNHLRAA